MSVDRPAVTAAPADTGPRSCSLNEERSLGSRSCTRGSDEQHNPLRVIGLCLLATAVTLVLVRSEPLKDLIGSEACRS